MKNAIFYTQKFSLMFAKHAKKFTYHSIATIH